ncbi:MAG: hypothetical protein EVA78_06360 [Phycisphaeraceae bacterium]|nr:MAG: hypothetical protein EVA78_06360 [Phycisphaeraceae bacterium]
MDEVIDSLGNWLPQNPQQAVMNWMSSSPEANPHDEWVLSGDDLLEDGNENIALEQPGRGLGQDQSSMQAEVLQVAVRSIIVGVGVSVLVAVADLSFREGVSYRPILFGLVGVVVAGCVQALLRVMKSSS